jgi:alpha-1,2-mannosyltransferase
MVCALTALLVSPISWDHHWVWVAPGLAVLVDAAFRARSRWSCAAWAGAAVAVVMAFAAWPRWWFGGHVGLLQGGLIWYAPVSAFSSGDNPHYVEYHWRGLQEIAGNLYVIVGCVLFLLALASAAYALRTWQASQRQRSGTPQPGTPQRSRT